MNNLLYLCEAVDEFADVMKKRLLSKLKQGWHGWDATLTRDLPERMLKNAAQGCVRKDKKSLVDTANLAMMLWREQS